MKRFCLSTIFLLTSNFIFAQNISPLVVYTKKSHVLYSHCSNTISIKLPCDTHNVTNDQITFTAENSKVTIDSILNNQFYLSIIPYATTISLTLQATAHARVLGEETFIVQNLPPPSIHIYTGNKEIDPENGLHGVPENGLHGVPENILIKALSDESITEICGIDAQYIVTDFEIKIVKKATSLFQKTIKGNNIDLTTINSIHAADRIIISVNEIKIITPEGKEEIIRFGNTILTLPIVNSN
jgi:hypothetical protein